MKPQAACPPSPETGTAPATSTRLIRMALGEMDSTLHQPRALPTETKVEGGTSQRKSESSVNLSNRGYRDPKHFIRGVTFHEGGRHGIGLGQLARLAQELEELPRHLAALLPHRVLGRSEIHLIYIKRNSLHKSQNLLHKSRFIITN